MATKIQRVNVRIKRMGDQWATCGIGVFPPRERQNEDGIYDKCTKLVPGQVISLPTTHPLVGHHLTEVVRRPDADEFMRPWVFEDAAHAMLGDPSKANLPASEIANALALYTGAVDRASRELEARKQAAIEYAADNEPEEFGDDENEDPSGDDDERDDEDDEDPDTANERRSANREVPEIYEGAKPRRVREDPDADAEPAPVRRGRRGSKA